ncbi:MFS transporter [Streptomyces marincola]|uniref:MFS transporter n=1 Tax=Streptomyces marincola TaxID=2878388 RepID=UPI001CF0E3E5|nr:MFS transporter [Streptomyces marincola]UCM88679.1 MFS transporter [Streptomyces marincola]
MRAATPPGEGRGRTAAAVFLVAVFVSAMGDEIAAIAVLVEIAGSEQSLLVAALLILQIAPAVLLSPLAGSLLDRRDAARVLALASLVQAVVLLAMSAWPSTPGLIAGMAVVGVCAAVATPAVIVLMPLLAGEAFPARANGLLESSRAASTLLGPVIGGVLVAAVGIRVALLVDAVSFLLAACAIALARVHRPVERGEGPWWKGATDGLTFLARQPRLRAVLPVVVFTVSASSMVNVAMVFFVRDALDAGSALLGLLTAAWGAGALAGAALATRREWETPERAVLFGAAGMGLAILLFGAVAVAGVTLVMAFAAGVANAYQNIAMRTSVQVRTPKELLGRAHAAAGSVVNTFFLVGYAIGGVFAASDARATFLVAGAVTVVAACAGLAMGDVRLRPAATRDRVGSESAGG